MHVGDKLRMLVQMLKGTIKEWNDSNNAKFNDEYGSENDQEKPDLLDAESVYRYYYLFRYYHY